MVWQTPPQLGEVAVRSPQVKHTVGGHLFQAVAQIATESVGKSSQSDEKGGFDPQSSAKSAQNHKKCNRTVTFVRNRYHFVIFDPNTPNDHG